MEIIGDNWDYLIFKALDESPPSQSSSLENQHYHVVSTILLTVGESVSKFLTEHISDIASSADMYETDPVHLYMSEMGWYFLYMHKVMKSRDLGILPGWDKILSAKSEMKKEEIQIAFSFQIGFPLLIPHLVQNLYSKPVGIIVHSKNNFAIKFFEETLSEFKLYFLEELTTFDLLRAVKKNYVLVANIDTAYSGSRSSKMKFLNGSITIPTGLFTIAGRTNANMRCFAIPMRQSELIACMSSPFRAILDSNESAFEPVRKFFEPIIKEFPFQWMGWGNFRENSRIC